MNGNHIFMLGLGPVINASIFLSLIMAFKDLLPFGQYLKTLQDQGAEASQHHRCLTVHQFIM